MRVKLTNELTESAIRAFDVEGTLLRFEPYGSGHINDTFAAYFGAYGRTKRVIVQRINTDIFRDAAALMENVAGVTSFLRGKITARGGDPDRETLTLIPTKDGASTCEDASGVWRAYVFIERTTTFQRADSPARFAASARAFGRFQRDLADYPASTLHETIPRFHDTVKRYADLLAAVKSDPLGRVSLVGPELEFALSRERDAHRIVDALASGDLPLRVTHNDTKLNNVLFDDATGEGVCVIDLDTVMPGSALYDVGDSLRFGASTAAEDEKDLSRVKFDLDYYHAYADAFVAAAEGRLTQAELDAIPVGAKVITYENGLRFLTDYIQGDTYFKTHYDGQNLDRTRTQFALVADMEKKLGV